MGRRIARKKKREKKGYLKFLFLIFIPLLAALLFLLLRPGYWNSQGKLAVISQKEDDVLISLYDTLSDRSTDIVLPGNTQLLAAYGLGTWKLNSLWKLGEDEKIGEKLIARSIVKNFGFPVFVCQEDLSLGDRLRITIFDLYSGKNKNTILLKDSSYLKKIVFLDGEEGYVINKNISGEIAWLFSDQEEFSLLKAKIIDSSGSYSVSNMVGKIIETMGIKVASIAKGGTYEKDCKITGENKKLVKKVSLILGCGETEIKGVEAFDLEITLGSRFPQGF